MPSTSRLLDGGFYSFYLDAAALLGARYEMKPNPTMRVLEARHETFKSEIDDVIELGQMTGDQLWEYALARLAVSLCSCDCITYKMLRRLPAPYARNQDLLREFPAIYTGLQYARDQYMSAYLSERNVSTVAAFSYLDHPDLGNVMRIIRNDTREAANFAALLNLPS